MYIYFSTNQLIALHSTVQHSDVTRPVVFERKEVEESISCTGTKESSLLKMVLALLLINKCYAYMYINLM